MNGSTAAIQSALPSMVSTGTEGFVAEPPLATRVHSFWFPRVEVTVLMARSWPFASTRPADDLLLEAQRRMRRLPFVESVSVRYEDDVLVLTVTGSGLTLDEISEIVDVKWQLVDSFPGQYLDVDIRDRFGR